ncbi:hypothetical protein AgCh_013563 [Apium graveolens]
MYFLVILESNGQAVEDVVRLAGYVLVVCLCRGFPYLRAGFSVRCGFSGCLMALGEELVYCVVESEGKEDTGCIWCIITAIFLWLLKTLMVKVLASSFYVSTFFDRTQDSLFNQYVIEMLSGPPLIESQNNQDEEERTMIKISKLQNAGATLPSDLRSAIPSPAANRGEDSKLQVDVIAKQFRGH